MVPAAKSKNERISQTLAETKQRRKTQTCRTYELKLDKSHLSGGTLNRLHLLFLEAKWLYNHAVSVGVDGVDYIVKRVPVKVGNHFEEREIRTLSSQMRQEIVDRTKDNLKGLRKLKEKGLRAGKLGFKSRVSSIPLKQHAVTYRVLDGGYVKIQAVKQKLKVEGLEQIPASAELTSAILVRRHDDFYLNVATYTPKMPLTNTPNGSPKTSVGVDLGIKNQLTLSNGISIQYKIPTTRRLRLVCKELSRRKEHGRNWYETRDKLDKEYEKANNVKRDIGNKIGSKLTRAYDVVCFQDDNLRAWQRIYGKKMLSTSLGGLRRALRLKARTPAEVNRFYPSTQTCHRCGDRQKIGLDERLFVCHSCGFVIGRDLNAALNVEREGLRLLGVPAVRREFTPVDTVTSTLLEYFKGIPHVRASPVVEAGSPMLGCGLSKANDFSRG